MYSDAISTHRNGKFAGEVWALRHSKAADSIQTPRNLPLALGGMIKAWLAYADLHKAAYESGIGEDGFLGPEWAKIGQSLRDLLNGDTGPLDAGTLESALYDTLKAEGFDPDTM